MSHEKIKRGPIAEWIEYRLPIFSVLDHMNVYQTPKNLSYAWNFGSLLGLCLIVQILTGFFLSMHYVAHIDHAFDSVEQIMRNVRYGWLIRYTHAVGASMFFMVVYAHMARGLYYGSYKAPREILWMVGVVIYLLMMATAFLGYVLPWGQMSFWGATVITNLFSALPLVGESIVVWLWGGFSVDNPTLTRFYSLHFITPLIIAAVTMIHIVALHTHGSNNPTGVEVKSKNDTVNFHPYYTVKDLFGYGVFLIIFALFIFYAPNYLGHPDNYIEADPMVTPAHIVPEWYFLPFYAILRAVPSKLGGVLAMFGAIAILFVLPWLDFHKTKSADYRPIFRKFYWVFVANFVLLGFVGGKPAEGIYVILGRLATIYYFFHFIILYPVLSLTEKADPEPESISMAYSSNKQG